MTVELIQGLLLAFALVVILMSPYIRLLRAIGFAVEPALPQPATDGDVHLVWIDSNRLHCGGRAGLLPN